MALKMTLIDADSSIPSECRVHVFGHAGGRIGRAADNDWILPDPERYLSAYHARITCRQGEYFLEDISTNGVYVNGAADALAGNGPVRLREGDSLCLGNHKMQVHLTAAAAKPKEAAAKVSFAIPPSSDTASGLRSEFDIDQLLQLESTGVRARPVDAFGQPTNFVPARPQARPAAVGAEATTRSPDTRRKPSPSSGSAPDSAAIGDFCRGAGLDAASLPPESLARLLQVAGLLLREALVGVKQLDNAQRQMRAEHGAPASGASSTMRGQLANLQVEDLLIRLLGGHQSQSVDAVQWLRELFASARNHDTVFINAVRQALSEYLPQLESVIPARHPDHTRRFRSLTDMPDGQLPRLFRDALENAYCGELQRRASNG